MISGWGGVGWRGGLGPGSHTHFEGEPPNRILLLDKWLIMVKIQMETYINILIVSAKMLKKKI